MTPPREGEGGEGVARPRPLALGYGPMFTGIVTDLGRVRAVLPGGDTGYEIETRYDTGTIAIGASIACSGVCLTAIERGPGWFRVQASAETRARSTLRDWRIGTLVNLER